MTGEAKFLYKRQDIIKLISKDLFEKLGNRELYGIDLSTPGVFITKAKITSFPNPEVKIISVEEQVADMNLPSLPIVPRSARSVGRDEDNTGGNHLVFQFDRCTNTLRVFGSEVAWSVIDQIGAHWVGVQIEAPLNKVLTYGQQIPACVDGVPKILTVGGEVEEKQSYTSLGVRKKKKEDTILDDPIVLDLLEIYPQLVPTTPPEGPGEGEDTEKPTTPPEPETVPTTEVALAPLVGESEGTELFETMEIDAVEVKTEVPNTRIFSAVISGTGLKEHTATAGGAGKNYWIGIAVPKGTRYFQGRGEIADFVEFNENNTFRYKDETIQFVETSDGITDDGKAAFYFSVTKGEAGKVDTGVVIIENGVETYLVYVSFEDVYRDIDTLPLVEGGHYHHRPPVVPPSELPFYHLEEEEFILTIHPREKIIRETISERVASNISTEVLKTNNFVTVYLDARFTSHEIILNWGEEFAPEVINVQIEAPLQDVAVKKIPPLPKEPKVEFIFPEEEQTAQADISVDVDLSVGK